MSRRGAPAGNTNALKHGFYSRSFLRGEAADLEALETSGLADEVNMLRIATRRLFDLVSTLESPTFSDLSDALDSLGMACTRIRTLVVTQSILSGDSSPVSDALTQALSKVYEELHL